MENISNSRPDFRASRRVAAPRAVDLEKLNRLPPHSVEAEQGILGCALLSPNDSLDILIQKFRGSSEVWYDLRHKQVYELLVKMHTAKDPIDLITVQQELKDQNQLEAVGGLTYLAALQDAAPSAANLSYYADIVVEKYTLRRMIQICSSVVASVYEHEGEVDELLARVERDILGIRDSIKSGQADRTTWDILLALKAKYERARGGVAQLGISTGFRDLDRMIGGMGDQEVIYLAGSPSSGKTSFAINVGNHVLLNLNLPVGVFSLETSDIKFVHRMACARSGVNGKLFFEGVADLDLQMLQDAALTSLQEASDRLFICEQGGLTIAELLAKGRRMAAAGVRFVIVDYLQLLSAAGKDATEQTTAKSVAVKLLAKQMNCPVLVISSLTKEGSSGNNKPKKSDLRQSGQMEYDADHIWLLHCADPSKEVRDVSLNVAKGKESDIGEIELRFYKTAFMFKNAAITVD